MSYEGSAAASFAEPVVLVAATTALDGGGRPHALAFIEDPDLTGQMPYELNFLEPGAYFVVATIADAAGTASATPVGAFPNSCVLEHPGPDRSLRLGTEAPAEQVDIVIRDAIAADPCAGDSEQLDLCPSPAEASIELTVAATGLPAPGPQDALVVALATRWPAESFVRLRRTGGAQVALPQALSLSGVVPGAYHVYACLDRGGDGGDQPCGPGDSWLVSPEAHDIAGGAIHRFALDLGTAAVSASAPEPADQGRCRADARLALSIGAPGLVPGPGDQLSASLFRDFPGPRQPDFAASSAPDAFPTQLTVAAAAGSYYLVVCFQRAGSPSSTCSGPEDRLFLYQNLGATISLVSGRTTNLDVELPP